jgi:hypothetical protein
MVEAEELSMRSDSQAAMDAKNNLAAAELKAAELRLRAAELQAEDAAAQVAAAAAQFEEDTDRIESAKVGAIAAAAGAAGVLPALGFAVASSPEEVLLSLAGTAASCFLFGVTYRYALRGDLGNTQLKSGVVGAFGLTRGLGQAAGLLTDPQGGLRLGEAALGGAALAAGEAMLAFGFASAAIEIAFKNGWVKPRT